MEFDDHIEEPEGDFIPGIYNYCNRWCERCLYTDRCRVFADEKIFMHEIEKEKKREKSMAENKEFWDQVNKTITEAAELIDEEIPLMKNKPLFEQWDDDEDDDIEETLKELEELRKKAENHELSKIAHKYEKTAGKWFKERKEILKQDYNPKTKDFKVSYQGIADEDGIKKLSESVEVVQWYHIQIWIKIHRALTSLYEENEDKEIYEGFPKDSDGSARVVLIGIDSSIGAWNYLLRKLDAERETIKPIISMLVWLRIETEKMFPNARSFAWPPNLEEE